MLGALEAEGFQPGDEIEIAGMTLELDPEPPDGRTDVAQSAR